MALVKIRQGMVYTLTGIFFLVAATGQLAGDTVSDAFLKAGVACAVLTGMSLGIIYILDDAARKLAAGSGGSGPGKLTTVRRGSVAQGGTAGTPHAGDAGNA